MIGVALKCVCLESRECVGVCLYMCVCVRGLADSGDVGAKPLITSTGSTNGTMSV